MGPASEPHHDRVAKFQVNAKVIWKKRTHLLYTVIAQLENKMYELRLASFTGYKNRIVPEEEPIIAISPLCAHQFAHSIRCPTTIAASVRHN